MADHGGQCNSARRSSQFKPENDNGVLKSSHAALCMHTHTRPQTRKRQGAWSVDTGRGQRGVND